MRKNSGNFQLMSANKLDPVSIALIRVFQEVPQFHPIQRDPAKYFKGHRREIKAVGRLLEYLSLARADKRSALGWKPKRDLLELIAKRKARPDECDTVFVCDREELLVYLMLDTALGADSELRNEESFCCEVMTVLGLMEGDGHGGWRAKQGMVWYFEDAYHKKQEFF
jgi:hypothetical protein